MIYLDIIYTHIQNEIVDMLCYAGIGSRKTPEHICDQFTELAYLLAYNADAKLRTGGAIGADTAFIVGSDAADDELAELYLPWNGYNDYYTGLVDIPQWAFDMASKYHDYWDRCGPGAKKMHARNCQIVFGKDGNEPVDFIICYTDGGRISGGTGMALRLAKSHNIKVYNFGARNYTQEIIENYLQ